MNEENKPKDYVIVLDTNSVYYDLEEDFSKLFNNSLLDLKQFVNKNKLKKVSICIPEIVIQERITQQAEKIIKDLDNLNKKHERLKIFGVKITNIPLEKEIRKKLLEFSQELKSEEFLCYPLPKPKIEDVIQRSYLKIVPFQNGGKGFKDTILWYSILENCNDKKIILISNDKVFLDNKDYFIRELKKNGGKQLEIFNTIESTKSFLRKEFNLDENIEIIHEQIKKDIKDKLSNILFDIIGEKYYYSYIHHKKMLIGGFFIKDIIFKNISENYVFIDLSIKVKAKLFESQEEKENELYETAMYTDIIKTPYWSPFRYPQYPLEKDLIIELRLHKLEDNYNVAEHSINEDYGAEK